jgi:hypothetical protein
MTDILPPSESLSAVTLFAWTRDGARHRLALLASPAWSDGAHVWLVADAVDQAFVGAGAAALLTGPSGLRALARGSVRAYGLHDPVGLALHGAAVAAALGALALRAAGAVRRALPGSPFALRLQVETLMVLERGADDGGIAPALPAAAPSDIRRALAGVRDVIQIGRAHV